MSEWTLAYRGFDASEEGLRESLCALGNGYFVTRAVAPEAEADDVHYPGTYMAGGYNRLQTEIAGRTIENEDLVNLPNWLSLSFRVRRGEWFDLSKVEIVDYRQELDLKHGVLHRQLRFRDPDNRRTRLTSRCLVHMAKPHLAALETTLMAENWSGAIEIRSALDGRVMNSGVARYRGLANRHVVPIDAQRTEDRILLLQVRTSQSHLWLAQAARSRLYRAGQKLEVPSRVQRERGYIGELFALDLPANVPVTVEKVMAMYSSRDRAVADPALQATQAARDAPRFGPLLETHALAWAQLWRRFGTDIGDHVDLESYERTVRVLRLHAFHLLQTASPHIVGRDVGIPARGLHGEAYRGHVFWDELFIFPFLNLRLPEISRSLLRYRYARLDAARANARAIGLRGAMYPWQSGSEGREETQKLHRNPISGRWLPDHSHLQRHVNAAIVYNIWQYYQASGDREFMAFCGAEMILEIARFWASAATYNDQLDRYEILGVMGPDEYHDRYPDDRGPGLNNNTYTNVMAVWCLCRALDVLDHLPPDRHLELSETLALEPAEFERWQDISHKMRIVFNDGIISQFEGYEKLDEFDWEGYRSRHGDIQRLDRILEAEDDTPNNYKVSKQADLLMLFYLFSSEELKELFERLGYAFVYNTIPDNIEHYLARTSHGSTLSRVVHAWVLARSDRVRAWQLLDEALMSDVGDIQGGTTAEGIHLGAMAGSVDVVLRVFAGIETRADTLWLNPALPKDVGRLRLNLRYRGNSVALDITPDQVEIRTVRFPAWPIQVGCRGKVFEMKPGDRRVVAL